MSDSVLFLPLNRVALLEMLPLAEAMLATGRFRPHFIISFEQIGDGIDRLEMAGLGWQPVRGAALRKAPANSTSAKSESVPMRRHWPGRAWFAFGRRYWLIRQQAIGLVVEHHPALIVVISDRGLGLETAMVWAANRLGIPSLIIPFAISTQAGAVQLRRRHADFAKIYLANSGGNGWLARRYPQWSLLDGTDRILFQSVPAMVVAKLLGMMPANPWTLGGGQATHMAVESERARQTFLAQGMRSQKMSVTGKPSADIAYWQMEKAGRERQQLLAQLGLEEDRPVILCSVPQLGEHQLLPWPEHWHWTEFVFAELAATGAQLLLSLHPKSDPANYQPLAEKYNAIMPLDKSINEIMALADLFVATFSSTVVLAMANGIPTIVIDFFRLGYETYADCQGIITLRDDKQFRATVTSVLDDDETYQRLSQAQKASAQEWIRFDGQNSARVLALAEALITGERIAGDHLDMRQASKGIHEKA